MWSSLLNCPYTELFWSAFFPHFPTFPIPIFRSSHQRCSVRQGVLRNFTKFTGKHLCQSLFFNKVAGVRPAFLLKKKLWNRCFPVNFVKFLRTPCLQNTSGRLLLYFLCILSLRQDNFLPQLEDLCVVRAYFTVFEKVHTQ